VGITLFAWLATRLGLATLPDDVGWRQIYGVGWLARTGFTMSLFIADLAFDDSNLLASAKVGILVASIVAGGIGYLLLSQSGSRRVGPASMPEPAPRPTESHTEPGH